MSVRAGRRTALMAATAVTAVVAPAAPAVAAVPTGVTVGGDHRATPTRHPYAHPRP